MAVAAMAADTDLGPGVTLSPADEAGRYVYLIEFAESGAMHRDLRVSGERFDASTERAQGIFSEIKQEQANHLQAMNQVLGRAPEVTHRYLVSHSGVAVRLLPQEAEMVRLLEGVVSIERDRLYEMDTFRGPSFIGADTIWDGSATPGNVATKGEGTIVAVLDSGLDSDHPSFANDPSCDHGGANPDKLLSLLDCSRTDGTGLCNGFLPEDSNGHGTHTSSTAVGNTLDDTAVPAPTIPSPYTTISGVAPCASIRHYKVCPTNSCPGTNIQAGMDSVLLHGDASVMNFSISGGRNPWTDNDRRKLDLVDAGVFVAASAGNTSSGTPDPVGEVNHLGPWILSVAASTHDEIKFGVVSATGPGTPPEYTENILADQGNVSPDGGVLNDYPIKHYTGQPDTEEGCDSAPPFPADFFDGAVALIHRGTCTFTEKITNAFNAGADFVLIRNNVATGISMDTTGQPNIPAYSIEQVPGDALVAFVDANPDSATIDFATEGVGDVLASFSLRGPTPAPLEDLTKPDITAPGVSIYAAVVGGYDYLSGTSMSGPHAAGAATLVRAIHPDWTPMEVKSALMMTAFTGGTKEDGVSSWDPDDVGSGAVDLSTATLAGLVMDETTANLLAADPGSGGDPKTLNLPAVRNMTCTPNCVFTRTVRNTLGVATNWTAMGMSSHPALDIQIEPATFGFTGDTAETQVLTITVTPFADLSEDVAFGAVVLSEIGIAAPEGQEVPDQLITVSIKGNGSLFSDGFEAGNTDEWSATLP